MSINSFVMSSHTANDTRLAAKQQSVGWYAVCIHF